MPDIPRPKREVSYEDLVKWAQSYMAPASSQRGPLMAPPQATQPFTGLPMRAPPTMPQLPSQTPQVPLETMQPQGLPPGPMRPAPALPGYAEPISGVVPRDLPSFQEFMDAVRRRQYTPMMFERAPIPERPRDVPGGYERFLDYSKRIT